MRIGIDARLIGETGVGRYTRNLIRELARIDSKNTYVLFLRKNAFENLDLPSSHFKKVLADVPWHTLTEQIVMTGIFLREKLDLLHVPYFNAPLLYPGKTVVTIHDLTILHFDTGKATTLPMVLYKLKRLGYWLELTFGLRQAKKIIAVSKTSKQEIIDHFGIDPSKIAVTYEGVDEKVKSQKRIIEDPYFLYVGNAYPHKNLELLLRAFQAFIVNSLPFTVKLVLVGKEDYFYSKLKLIVKELDLGDEVIYFGEANDTQLTNLYGNAIALIFPSLMEGFGLPAIEALSCGCPVICSDIPVFHEILEDVPTYFDPFSVSDLLAKMTQVVKKQHKEIRSIDLAKFSWEKMAKETLDIYENCLRV
ncbi:glycosyltransferase family 4 protein [Patescibacteria group bacterium]|nr:glycosyltransferase family 4 protein [Patescibacteria group bacterium]MBU1473191.1 glycosyltransferase family 4 protein [Patescibacteria group bacterium]MBU2459759.1 glycosyltransferase family 4 protein [Patescibacteria group bacterium]MBU2544271.1 glycosyltransferase family 4 protein [Patescibacteria group bacterium]